MDNENLPMRIGIDVGSTTVKVAVLDENDKLIYGDYQRHRADIRSTDRKSTRLNSSHTS